MQLHVCFKPLVALDPQSPPAIIKGWLHTFVAKAELSLKTLPGFDDSVYLSESATYYYINFHRPGLLFSAFCSTFSAFWFWLVFRCQFPIFRVSVKCVTLIFQPCFKFVPVYLKLCRKIALVSAPWSILISDFCNPRKNFKSTSLVNYDTNIFSNFKLTLSPLGTQLKTPLWTVAICYQKGTSNVATSS